jgi:hypothetical protein
VRSNKELAKRVIQARDVLFALSPTTDSYNPSGQPEQSARAARRLDLSV